MLLFVAISLIIICVNQTFGNCNICGNNSKSICLNQSEFQICDGDKPINELGIFNCPRGFICVDDPLRCLPAENNKPSCGENCEICDPITHIACVNEYTFALCFDENPIPSRVLGFCENGKVCNAQSPIICVDNENEEATCPDYTHTTSTTPATTITSTTDEISTLTPTSSNLDDICRQYGKPGKYPIPGNCESYIFCIKSGNYLIGRQYNCLHENVFDCKIRQCIINGDCDYSCSYNHVKKYL